MTTFAPGDPQHILDHYKSLKEKLAEQYFSMPAGKRAGHTSHFEDRRAMLEKAEDDALTKHLEWTFQNQSAQQKAHHKFSTLMAKSAQTYELDLVMESLSAQSTSQFNKILEFHYHMCANKEIGSTPVWHLHVNLIKLLESHYGFYFHCFFIISNILKSQNKPDSKYGGISFSDLNKLNEFCKQKITEITKTKSIDSVFEHTFNQYINAIEEFQRKMHMILFAMLNHDGGAPHVHA